MLSYLADLTAEKDYGRLEWPVHDWNEPAIERYKNWGALPIGNIRVFRLSDNNLRDFSGFYKNINQR